MTDVNVPSILGQDGEVEVELEELKVVGSQMCRVTDQEGPKMLNLLLPTLLLRKFHMIVLIYYKSDYYLN